MPPTFDLSTNIEILSTNGFASVPLHTDTCSFLAVDGGWGSWIAWTMCTEKCGFRGIRTRVRKCNDPSPIRGGKYCIGNDYVRAEACNRKPCMDGKSLHIRHKANCHLGWRPCRRSKCSEYCVLTT